MSFSFPKRVADRASLQGRRSEPLWRGRVNSGVFKYSSFRDRNGPGLAASISRVAFVLPYNGGCVQALEDFMIQEFPGNKRTFTLGRLEVPY